MPAPPLDATTGTTLKGFALAMVAGLFAYGGWHMVTFTAGETRNAATTIPRALAIGTLIVTACYAGLNAIYLRVLPLAACLWSPLPLSIGNKDRPQWMDVTLESSATVACN